MNKKKIIKLSKKDFEKAWTESKNLVKKPHPDNEYPRLKYNIGKSHVLYDTISELREAYLRLGFSETVNPLFIDKNDVYKQFGPEAPAVLDRCFYLAGLPRPDIGIGMDKIQAIKELNDNVNDNHINNIQEVFRRYKKGDLDGDDLTLEVANALEVNNEKGLAILEKVFPEIRELTPVASNTTLRSHMTSGWFISLEKMVKENNVPIKMFSIDRCFRREQKEDSSHLMTYHSASCVIVDDEVSLDTGKAISEALLQYFGFSKFKFIPDEKKSKYYIPETQTEVYGYHPKLGEWVEIATFGLYSPIALSKYGIDKEVMNLGLGVERIAMVLNQIEDVRELVYPQLYKELSLNDREIATMLNYNYYPVTEEGKALMRDILNIWENNMDENSPCEFTIFEGEFLNKAIVVKALEEENNTKLLGPASTNQIYIYDGNILGIPENIENTVKKVEANPEKYDKNEIIGEIPEDTKIVYTGVEKGIPTNIRYIDSLAAKTAYKIEEAVISGSDDLILRNTIARSLSDVNLKLDDIAMKYINDDNKLIDIRGPIFSTIKLEVK
ncbi:O-phosphoserine--tRNA ligase [Methanobrevibacter sp. TMH8]|uniref:O-phosphoserine--tRNA ligase n=1 Tax=Methanobrevibacter sp. TMH8 TaxID=2848611 RepID=UPI001CCA4294|nr:O-phosphoserine--tRNA ligase [Methanobrevibacter sp. TMH8]MBZ9571125.1 O-phosphoserine--tRNA ligase [Methanobrevibacter sp. TMH8]